MPTHEKRYARFVAGLRAWHDAARSRSGKLQLPEIPVYKGDAAAFYYDCMADFLPATVGIVRASGVYEPVRRAIHASLRPVIEPVGYSVDVSIPIVAMTQVVTAAILYQSNDDLEINRRLLEEMQSEAIAVVAELVSHCPVSEDDGPSATTT